MGLSSSKSKTTTKPVYSAQIEGAAGNVTNAYNAQAPKVTAVTDALGGLVPGLIEKYTAGDPNVNAAKSYNLDVLQGKYLNGNPYLDSIVDKTANTARNQTAGALGTRGLTGGSAFADIISRNVSDASNTLRYNDYNAERGRMDSAVGASAGLSAAEQLPIATLLEIAQAQQLPVQTAAGAGSAVGGLLGSYTNSTTKQSMPLGSLLAGLAGSALSGWATGGFK
jgi:hypothetical protein